ncbi:MAG: class I SAM-dependent methyltransferase [Verrucomicrobia bacterium]|jgi:23S rRNA (cytosine1962-C5)-methyltransferase|nr:class I SAM-dependent methyltransferase [Verrucomicrobiota bacterium]
MIPCIIFEDEHLLVVNKPAGWNTHAPSPYAGEGIYDWLKHREPRWANLAIIHRLDKETSGGMVFGKTELANRSLTEQFAGRNVGKKYLLLTDREPKQREFTVKSKIVRAGERYVSGAHGEPAETWFGVPASAGSGILGRLKAELRTVEASPLTGRTHQIRVHAAENGFPILGDTLYGGSSFQRVCLHAAEINFKHPATNEVVTFTALADFETDARLTLRAVIIEPEATDSFRLVHGASDGWTGWYVERLGDFLLSQSEAELTDAQHQRLATMPAAKAGYHKFLNRQVRKTDTVQASPKLASGKAAPERFTIRENGVKFELSFGEGYSVGLFLDQRDNRRRLLTGNIAADFPLRVGQASRLSPSSPESVPEKPRDRRDACPTVLNTFAYTCSFSVCAALGGARTTSVDLSKKYLEWGKRNFALNGLDSAKHDFIYGDTFDWLKRLAKKQRAFDAVVLDPPTFSQSKESGVFRAEKDYGKLVAAALPVLKRGGVLFASTNAAEWSPEDFLARVEEAIRRAGRKIVQQHYVPQPPDFPVSRAEPAYLKTVWLRVG